MPAPAETVSCQNRDNAGPRKIEGPPSVFRRGYDALLLLVEAYEYAQELERDVWDFAVEIDALRQAGYSNNEFRWLVCQGFTDHAPETTLPGSETRSFSRPPHGPGLMFSPRTAFVLTHSGFRFARGALHNVLSRAFLVGVPYAKNGNGARAHHGLKPRWDRDRQELRVGDILVKQFKVPAANQERVLAAFEEEGWPVHIDDPLPPAPDQDPKRRLHDTINSLNRNQKRRLVRFVGDGTGQGVRWQLAHPPGNGRASNGD
jgi:hypothetical protein